MVAFNSAKIKQGGLLLFSKLLRTKDPSKLQGDDLGGMGGPPPPGPDGEAGGPPGGGGKLKKCLTTLDLTSLGVGSCVGTGMYLVAGMVAKNVAGPAVILSFIIAAVASIFSGVCYAEFGVRVPNTSGGAYMYSYVTVGEFMAFVIGWNMILEELIGTSACACALSACFDALLHYQISNGTEAAFGTIYETTPDILAFFLILAMAGVLVAGVRKSILFNNCFNCINFAVWIFIMISSWFYMDTKNWTEHGGFMPMGWSGVLTGAATCFYAFIGFDIIATTGEEAMNPKKSIPYSIVLSLVIVTIAYVSSSAVITLMVPYNLVDEEAALVGVFGMVGAHRSKKIVAIGAIAGLTVSMFGSFFSLPRIVYAMAKDGLLFNGFSAVWYVTGTPAVATIFFGVFAGVAALFFSLHMLVEMMSIGTLLAYTLVSACVLILRYQPHSKTLVELLPESIRTPLPGTPLHGSPTKNMTNLGLTNAIGNNNTSVSPHHLTAALQQNGGHGRFTSTGLPLDQKVTVKKVSRMSPDSDDTGATEEGSIEFSRREDDYMVNDKTDNKYYGAVPTSSGPPRWYDSYIEKVQHTFPSLFPWVEAGPCTEETGKSVMKLFGILFINILTFDLILLFNLGGLEGHSPVAVICCIVCFVSIVYVLCLISRKPQNRANLEFLAPGLPWVPAIAITINIYLIFKLNIYTLIRFIVWMAIGLFIYFYYGISHSVVDQQEDFELHVTSDLVSSHPPTQIVTPSSITAPVANTLSPNSGLQNNTIVDFGKGVTEDNYTTASPSNPFKSNPPQANPFQTNPFQNNPNPFR